MAIILRIKRTECEVDNTDTYAVNTSPPKNLGIRKKMNQEMMRSDSQMFDSSPGGAKLHSHVTTTRAVGGMGAGLHYYSYESSNREDELNTQATPLYT
jgi:hypothetical protein